MKYDLTRKMIMALLAGTFMVSLASAEEWDKLWKPEGQGQYDNAPLDAIKFGEYVTYQDRMPVKFRVANGSFAFVGQGFLTVSNERQESSFYKDCKAEGAAWISYFNSLAGSGKQKVHVNIKGVEIACGRYVYPVQELDLTFADKGAQSEWESRYAEKDRSKRDSLVKTRIEEQIWREKVRENSGVFTDPRDGQIYRTIKIDDRQWLAQNMSYKVEGRSWCYDEKESNCSRGGRLYDLDGARDACPKGWHLPRDREFNDMLTNLTRCYSGVHTCKDFGKKLKAKVGWDGDKGTDEYGFAVYSTGFRDPQGKFEGMGGYSGFWTNQSGRVETNYIWVLEKASPNMQRLFAPSKKHAYAVRCVEGD